MKTILLSIFGVIVAYVAYVVFYTGVLKVVKIEKVESGPEFHLVYKVHTGAYHEIDRTITQVEDWLAAQNIGCATSFGHYLDDAESVAEERLQSHGGCVLSQAFTSPNDQFNDQFLYKKIEPQPYVKATFLGSPAFGPLKVYPKVLAYVESNGLKRNPTILEVYVGTEGGGMETTYYFPLSK